MTLESPESRGVAHTEVEGMFLNRSTLAQHKAALATRTPPKATRAPGAVEFRLQQLLPAALAIDASRNPSGTVVVLIEYAEVVL